MATTRVLLIGDPIIDNRAYVSPGEPDVTQQLQALLPQHPVVKRALDGATPCSPPLNMGRVPRTVGAVHVDQTSDGRLWIFTGLMLFGSIGQISVGRCLLLHALLCEDG
jgi:hypothetical protein